MVINKYAARREEIERTAMLQIRGLLARSEGDLHERTFGWWIEVVGRSDEPVQPPWPAIRKIVDEAEHSTRDLVFEASQDPDVIQLVEVYLTLDGGTFHAVDPTGMRPFAAEERQMCRGQAEALEAQPCEDDDCCKWGAANWETALRIVGVPHGNLPSLAASTPCRPADHGTRFGLPALAPPTWPPGRGFASSPVRLTGGTDAARFFISSSNFNMHMAISP